ncbi:MAG TPA: FAD-binding oxidoreductase, partial [Candidatus Saccharimonadales bacterium]|nr:FAD-binding oxidoreductase [Candidatus Saccharimonadales bacterium]
MNKVAHYLQEHLIGEVVTSDDARKFFSTDGSIFQIEPAIIAYPRNENDVRKTARFVWQLAERGRMVPLTSRGLGSNTTGSSINGGIIVVFPAHLNKILELDTKSGSVVVEPGVSIDKLQQALHTHGRFLTTTPVNYHYSSIGGALGRNSAGEHSIKYGSIKNYVKKARVVLSNGEVIETRRLNKREFNKKMGLSTFEGEIYRALDGLMEENHDIIKNFKLDVAKNSAGYDIFSVRRKDKSFDLTPLIVGSEGTLGIITEVELETEPYNPKTTVITAKVDDINKCGEALQAIRSLKDVPSTVDIIDKGIISFIAKTNPNQIKGIFTEPYPAVYMIIEFDGPSDRKQQKSAHKVKKILEKHEINYSVENDEDQ